MRRGEMSKKCVTPEDVENWEDYGRWVFDQGRYQELLEEHGWAVAEAYTDGCMEPDDAELSKKSVTPADVTEWDDYGNWVFEEGHYKELLGKYGRAVANAYVKGCVLELVGDGAGFSPKDIALEDIGCAACHVQGAAELMHDAVDRAAEGGDREESFRLFGVYRILKQLDETLYILVRMTEGLPTDNPK
jgi:hypothetical protein